MTAPPPAKPRACSASQACTPPPASSPNAEPPESAMASIRSTVLATSSSAPSRVPGPPPRTSIAATAGLSKITAVTPDANAASSAWPTRTPAISVRRFFKQQVRPAARALDLSSSDIAVPKNASIVEGHSEHSRQIGLAIRFGKQQHAGIEPAMMNDGVLGIPRGVQRLERGPLLQGLVNELAAVHGAGHDHVGEQQVDLGSLVENVQGFRGVTRFQSGVTETRDLGDHISTYQCIVLDDQNN